MMSWTKNGRIVEDDPKSRFVVTTEGCFSLLQIKDVQLDDATWYQCNAINRLGQAATRARLIIMCPGTNLSNAVKARRKRIENKTAKPAIKPAHRDQQKPKGDVERPDTDAVIWPNPPHHKQAPPSDPTAKPTVDPGFFAPGMFNYALGGSPDSDAYDLILKRNMAQACHPEATPEELLAAGHVPPDLVPTLTPADVYNPENPITPHFRTAPTTQLNIVEGKSAQFKCILVPVGDPDLRVEWYKDGERLSSGHRWVPEYDHNGTCSLTILHCYPEDSGAYQCVATNAVGLDEVETYLTCTGIDSIQ